MTTWKKAQQRAAEAKKPATPNRGWWNRKQGAAK